MNTETVCQTIPLVEFNDPDFDLDISITTDDGKSNGTFCHSHDSCYICQRIKTKRIMAKPIKETPVLTGDDATRFAEAAHEVVPASQKEKDDAKKAYSFFASIANFAL